jgi:hypothetical protein
VHGKQEKEQVFRDKKYIIKIYAVTSKHHKNNTKMPEIQTKESCTFTRNR